MAVLSEDEYRSRVSEVFNTDSEDHLRNIEDFIDTYTDLRTRSEGDGVDWKAKYETNDAEWRSRYRERFFSGAKPDGHEPDMNSLPVEEKKEIRYEESDGPGDYTIKDFMKDYEVKEETH